MAYQDKIVKTFDHIAKNLNATHTVMAIAAVKGICRPTFTMMDKTENPETKKYTALREGLTEAIAIPAYWTCGEIAGKCAKRIFKNNEGLAKRAETNLMFMGVCAAALVVIPALCSVAIKPIMNKLGLKSPQDKQNEQNKPKNIDITSQSNPVKITNTAQKYNVYPNMNTFINKPQSGLRVGGL